MSWKHIDSKDKFCDLASKPCFKPEAPSISGKQPVGFVGPPPARSVVSGGQIPGFLALGQKVSSMNMHCFHVLKWVWLKIKELGLRRILSLVPFAKGAILVHMCEPQPNDYWLSSRLVLTGIYHNGKCKWKIASGNFPSQPKGMDMSVWCLFVGDPATNCVVLLLFLSNNTGYQGTQKDKQTHIGVCPAPTESPCVFVMFLSGFHSKAFHMLLPRSPCKKDGSLKIDSTPMRFQKFKIVLRRGSSLPRKEKRVMSGEVDKLDNSVDFARAYGALGWALSKVIKRKEPRGRRARGIGAKPRAGAAVCESLPSLPRCHDN